MEYEIDASSLFTLARRYRGAEQVVRDETEQAMRRSVLAIEGTAKGLVPVDTGHLRRSLTHQVVASTSQVIGRVGTNTPYGPFVEKGTRPHWPPVAAVAGWARRHGIEPFLVARAIARRGTPPRPYLRPALDRHKADIAQEFRSALGRIVRRLSAGG